jgi:hypothetical protein
MEKIAPTQSSVKEAEIALENFIQNILPGEMVQFKTTDNDISIVADFAWCDIETGREFSRRLLILSDPRNLQVRVCVESAFQTFECETCFHVERVGTFFRDEAATELEPLLHRAFERMLNWQITPENIWDFIQF